MAANFILKKMLLVLQQTNIIVTFPNVCIINFQK